MGVKAPWTIPHGPHEMSCVVSSPEMWLGAMEDDFPAEILMLLFRRALQIFQSDTLNKTISYLKKSFCFEIFFAFKSSH